MTLGYEKHVLDEVIRVHNGNEMLWTLACFFVFAPVISALCNWEIWECFSYFTDWNMWLTMLHFLLMVNCYSSKVHHRTKPRWLALAHMTFELAMITNIIMVVIYWTFLHQISIEKFKENYWRTVHMYIVHSFPMLAIMTLWYANELRVCRSHWKILFVLSPVYALKNYYHFSLTGEVLYFFLNWEDYKTPMYFAMITFIACIWFMIMAELSYMVRPLHKPAFKIVKNATNKQKQK